MVDTAAGRVDWSGEEIVFHGQNELFQIVRGRSMQAGDGAAAGDRVGRAGLGDRRADVALLAGAAWLVAGAIGVAGAVGRVGGPTLAQEPDPRPGAAAAPRGAGT